MVHRRNERKSMDWSFCKMRKRTPNEIFHIEFQELVNKNFNDHPRIYTDATGQRRKKKWDTRLKPISNQHEEG
jgi:hypothetical protein